MYRVNSMGINAWESLSFYDQRKWKFFSSAVIIIVVDDRYLQCVSYILLIYASLKSLHEWQ
jgi:hypothetical protein